VLRSLRLGVALLILAFTSAQCFGSSSGLHRPTRPGQKPPAVVTPPAKKRLSTSQAPKPNSAAKQPSKLPKTEWVSAPSFASRLGIKFSWIVKEKTFRIKTPRGDMEFEVDSRECSLHGLRAFLGEPVRMVKGLPSFSRIDEQKMLLPLIRPGAWQTSVPKLRRILIDPGHGGRDSGMVNKKLNLEEKELVLDTAFRLKALLEKDGYQVLLTRKDDKYIELAERADMADRANADLFVSIHFNSVEQGAEKVTGVEVFTMTPQYQLSVDQQPDPVYAPIPNPGNEHDHWNTLLGASLHGSLLKELKVPDRGFKRGRLAVLRLAPCPAALVEAGYLSNMEESKKLAEAQYRQRIAQALAHGIKDYAIALEGARRTARR